MEEEYGGDIYIQDYFKGKERMSKRTKRDVDVQAST